jgi:tRNA (cmo5U34)-methyltransferase
MKSPAPIVSFDKEHASRYDTQFTKLAPMRDALHCIMEGILTGLPETARILCVGAGTGSEILFLAQRFPSWQFTAVDPSAAMLEVCRTKAAAAGIAERCTFHAGYLDSLPHLEPFDAATSILVSQFVLDPVQRAAFFRTIAANLHPGGILVSADLASDVDSKEYRHLLEVWLELMSSTGLPPEKIDQLRVVYGRDVAVLPVEEVSALMTSGGFETPVLFFQTVLIHAWYARVPGKK